MSTRRLYLVRHGKAASSDVDPQRGLTEQGLQEVKKIAEFIKPLDISVDYVWHSGKRRAEQTAQVLAEAVTVREEFAAHSLLAPNEDVTPIKDEIELAGQDVMIVGHLPFLPRLASLLMTGSESANPIAFKPAAIACLEQPTDNHWQINWVVTPEIVVHGQVLSNKGDRMTTEEKKRIVKVFCDQYVWLRIVFDEYRDLYENGEERVRLLEEVAKNFFDNLFKILVQYVLLNMCKFTDAAHFHQDDNLSVPYMLELVGPKVSEELGLDKLSEKICAIKPYIVEARNKRIVHFDREVLASNRIVGAFPPEVGDSFWESLRKFVDKVHEYYFDSIVGDVRNITGARDLVNALKHAVDYKDYSKQRENATLMLERRQKMRYKDA